MLYGSVAVYFADGMAVFNHFLNHHVGKIVWNSIDIASVIRHPLECAFHCGQNRESRSIARFMESLQNENYGLATVHINKLQ